MELGPFVPDVHNINAHRHLVCFTVRLLFKSNFPCRPTLTARPTIPTARPNVPPGAVTQGITNPEAHVISLHLPAEVPEARRAVPQAVRQDLTAAAAALKEEIGRAHV